jgi:hypothetical protein
MIIGDCLLLCPARSGELFATPPHPIAREGPIPIGSMGAPSNADFLREEKMQGVDHDSCPCCAGRLDEPPPWVLTTWARYCSECAWMVPSVHSGAQDCPTHGEPLQSGRDEPQTSDG